MPPPKAKSDKFGKIDPEAKKYHALGPDGLANVGQKLSDGDIYVNRVVPEIQRSAAARGNAYEDAVVGWNPKPDSFKVA